MHRFDGGEVCCLQADEHLKSKIMESIIEKRRGTEWCSVELPDMGEDEIGSWEYMSDEDDEETYCSGGLWFEGKHLVDCDGCYELPKLVKDVLKENGFDTLDLDEEGGEL